MRELKKIFLMAHSKKENDQLRQEIDHAHTDSAEYTAYLMLKKSEKQKVIDRMLADHDRVMNDFTDRKHNVESLLQKQVEGAVGHIFI
jgi:hypothetical protein